jgi:hypothetical protein
VFQAIILHENDHILLIWTGVEGGEQAVAVKASELKTFMRARKGVPLVEGKMVGVVKLGVS